MIPLATPNLGGNEARYLQQCIETNFVSSVGPFVDRFEEQLAEAAGTPHAIATQSGTAALHLALLGLGIGAGDGVLMPSFTFIAPANAVAYTGAEPIFLDMAPDSWTLDWAALETFITGECETSGGKLVHRASSRNIAAILTVHTLGHPSDMAALSAIAYANDLPLVADGAAALGATCRGGPVMALGAVGALSFNGNKTITCGGGGALVGTDQTLMDLVGHLSNTARVSSSYDHDRIGYNYRMTNLQAAVGCAQLERLDELLAAKVAIAARYGEAFDGMEGLATFPAAAWAESAHWYSGVVVERGGQVGADDLIAALVDAGIAAQRFWKPVHLQAPFSHCAHGPLAVTEALWRDIVTLPCSTGLASDDQDRVIEAVHHAMVK